MSILSPVPIVFGPPTQGYTGALTPQDPELEVTEIISAAALGDVQTVTAILDSWLSKPPSDRFGIDRFIPAVRAATEGAHFEIGSLLLRRGIRPTIHDAIYATERRLFPWLELFLEHGWNINQPISWAEPSILSRTFDDKDLTEWFLAHGADPNAPCKLDLTPLSVAVLKAPFGTVRLLFDWGGSLVHGQLLHYAVRRETDDCLQMVQYIHEKGGQVNAIMYQDSSFSYELQKPFGLGTPLHDAAQLGRIDVVKLLLQKGANPMLRNTRGCTAKERAEKCGHISVAELLSEWIGVDSN